MTVDASSGSEARSETVEGVVERVTYENDETSFRVVRMTVEPSGDRLTVVGRMQRIPGGTRVRIEGRFETDARHGRQLRASTVLVLEPDTLEGLVRYLGSGLIPGIGPAFAKRIVEAFGTGALEVLDKNPDRLAEVPGIGKSRVASLARAWAEQRAVRDVMVFLQGHGVSPSFAVRIYRKYGADAIRIVSDNPYRLAHDVWGIGFHKADEIARTLGIARDAPTRMQAAVLHVLSEAGERGHVYVPRVELEMVATRKVDAPHELITDAVDTVCATQDARLERLPDRGDVVYSSRRYVEETGLSRLITNLRTAACRSLSKVGAAIEAFETKTGTALADAQKRVVERAAVNQVLVMTGGPGVGKTTVVRALIELYRAEGLRVGLAAPTGRASRRMTETTGLEAMTVHRLLEFDPKRGVFCRTENNPIQWDVLIVDESSMLDLPLAFSLFRAIPKTTRLVLVGDVDQLPSVGPGAVLRDIIESATVETVYLTQIFRQVAHSRIVQNAHRIRDGLIPETPARGDKEGDFFVVNVRDAVEASMRVKQLVVERIPKHFGYDPRKDVQVLTPMRRGDAGFEALNAMLQASLNPSGAELMHGGRSFRVGDKVMQLRNDYGRDVFNGDIGFVSAFDREDRKLTVCLEGRDVVYDDAQLDELALAYACSVHKSQGSEYPAVVVVMLGAHFVMLTRNLLYTAVTRGKRLVVLVTDRNALKLAVEDTRREERCTYLATRLRDMA